MLPIILLLTSLAADATAGQELPFDFIGLLGGLEPYQSLGGGWLKSVRTAPNHKVYASLVSTTAVPVAPAARRVSDGADAFPVHPACNFSVCCSTRTTESLARRIALSALRLGATAPPPLLACGPSPASSGAVPLPCHQPLTDQPLVQAFQTRLQLSYHALRSKLWQLGISTGAALTAYGAISHHTWLRATLSLLRQQKGPSLALPPSNLEQAGAYQREPPEAPAGCIGHDAGPAENSLLEVAPGASGEPDIGYAQAEDLELQDSLVHASTLSDLDAGPADARQLSEDGVQPPSPKSETTSLVGIPAPAPAASGDASLEALTAGPAKAKAKATDSTSLSEVRGHTWHSASSSVECAWNATVCGLQLPAASGTCSYGPGAEAAIASDTGSHGFIQTDASALTAVATEVQIDVIDVGVTDHLLNVTSSNATVVDDGMPTAKLCDDVGASLGSIAGEQLHQQMVSGADLASFGAVAGERLCQEVVMDMPGTEAKARPPLSADEPLGEASPHLEVASTTHTGGPQASPKRLELQHHRGSQTEDLETASLLRDATKGPSSDYAFAGLVPLEPHRLDSACLSQEKLLEQMALSPQLRHGVATSAADVTSGVSAPQQRTLPADDLSGQVAASEGAAALEGPFPASHDEGEVDAEAAETKAGADPGALEVIEAAPAESAQIPSHEALRIRIAWSPEVADQQPPACTPFDAVTDHTEYAGVGVLATSQARSGWWDATPLLSLRDTLAMGSALVAAIATVVQALVARTVRRRAAGLRAALEAARQEYAKDKDHLCNHHEALVSDLLGISGGLRQALALAEAEAKRQQAARSAAVQAAAVATRARAAAVVQIAQRVPELQRTQEELAQALDKAVREWRERGAVLTVALGRCRVRAERLIQVAAAERAAMEQQLSLQAVEARNAAAALGERHTHELDELRQALEEELSAERLRHSATAATAQQHRTHCGAVLRGLRQRNGRNLAAWLALRSWLGLQVEMLSERAERMAAEHTATLAEARSVVELQRLRVATAQQQLAEQVAVVVETNRTNEELTQLLGDKDSTILELEGELTTTSAALESQRRQRDDLQRALTATEESLAAARQEATTLEVQLQEALAAAQSAEAQSDRLAAANALLEQQVSQFVKTVNMLAEMEEAHLAPVRAQAAALERQMAAEREAAAAAAAERDAKLAEMAAELAEARREVESNQRARGELAKRLEEIERELRAVQSELSRLEEEGIEVGSVSLASKQSPGWSSLHSRDHNRDHCDRDQEAVLQQLLGPLGLSLPLPADAKTLLAAASPASSSAAAAAAASGLSSVAERAAAGGGGGSSGARASGSLRK